MCCFDRGMATPSPSQRRDGNFHIWVFTDSIIRRLSTLLKTRLKTKNMFLPLFDKRANFQGLLSCFDPLYGHPLAPIGTPIGSVDEHSLLTQNATEIRLPVN